LAGAASAQLMDGVVPLRPEEAMVEAMLRGWQAQQAARGLREKTIGARERMVRRFLAFTNPKLRPILVVDSLSDLVFC
jgi:integrase/recombinase XerC